MHILFRMNALAVHRLQVDINKRKKKAKRNKPLVEKFNRRDLKDIQPICGGLEVEGDNWA